MNGARVRDGVGRSTGFDAPRTACERDRPSKMDGSQQLGLDKAQVGEENTSPDLRCDLWSSRGPGQTRIGLWAGCWFKNFKFLLFLEIGISLVN
jgi:hypothetical protein